MKAVDSCTTFPHQHMHMQSCQYLYALVWFSGSIHLGCIDVFSWAVSTTSRQPEHRGKLYHAGEEKINKKGFRYWQAERRVESIAESVDYKTGVLFGKHSALV